jgi:hypothetical protein
MYYENLIDKIKHDLYSKLETYTLACFTLYGYSEDEVYDMLGHNNIETYSEAVKDEYGNTTYVTVFHINKKPLFKLIQWFEMDLVEYKARLNTKFEDLTGTLAE